LPGVRYETDGGTVFNIVAHAPCQEDKREKKKRTSNHLTEEGKKRKKIEGERKDPWGKKEINANPKNFPKPIRKKKENGV